MLHAYVVCSPYYYVRDANNNNTALKAVRSTKTNNQHTYTHHANVIHFQAVIYLPKMI